ncbi:unnamed protein product [Absidia cylindrospora]
MPTILICYYGLLVLLHRPFIERAGSGKSNARPSYSSFRIGSSAATRGIRIACHMEPRDFLMFPYAFSLYPVLQCCLIHMYNTKNPDTKIAGPAKVDLTTGLALINRLKKMSHNAHKLHFLLETIMENNSIILNQGYDMDDLQQAMVATVKGTVPSRISDVGRGTSKTENGPSTTLEHQLSPLQDQYYQLPKTPQYVDMSPSASQNAATPLLFQQSFEMSSLADIPMISSTPSPSSVTEAFSLKQFGFDTPGDPNQLDFTIQDISAFSKMDFLPPIPGYHRTPQQQPEVLLDQTSSNHLRSSNIPPRYSQSQQQQQQLSSYSLRTNFTPYPPLTTSDNASSPSVIQQQAHPIPIAAPIENHHDANTVFRYNPDNPFFDIPWSMDFLDIAWSQSNMFK